MNNTEESEPVRVLVLRALNVLLECALVAMREVVTFAVIGGCTYLVFWRGESGWLYVPAIILARLAR